MMKKIFLFCSAFILAPILRGWVLSILWSWFVDLPEISIIQGIGIAFIFGLLIDYSSFQRINDKLNIIARKLDIHENTSIDDSLAEIFGWLIGLLVMLAFGWVVHLFL